MRAARIGNAALSVAPMGRVFKYGKGKQLAGYDTYRTTSRRIPFLRRNHAKVTPVSNYRLKRNAGEAQIAFKERQQKFNDIYNRVSKGQALDAA
jgi:hypothetical protein